LLRRAVFAAVLFAALAAPQSAFAWNNGPQGGAGFGAQDWVLASANRFAISQGVGWLDQTAALKATAEPDSIKGDQVNHNCDRWGKHYGTSPAKVAKLYAQAVSLFRAGDRTGASRVVGLISHYYADTCDPLHTDDSTAEKRIGGPFERSVDRLLRSPSSYRSWASYDGFAHVSSASSLTSSAAGKAHSSYETLVTEYRRHGFDAKCVSIARKSVNRAANGMADIIMSIQQDAVEVAASPNISAHQGIAAGGGCYYVFDTQRITRYTASWVATGTNATPFAGTRGLTTAQAHLGDGCYHEGKLYVPAENWPSVTGQQILVFDAQTLSLETTMPTGQTHEVSSVCVAPGTGGKDALWVSSYEDSSRLFEYDLDTLRYVGSKALHPAPVPGIQGLTFSGDTFYIAASAVENVGHLYSVSQEGSTTPLYTRHGPGYHEGLEAQDGQLLWLIDRRSEGSKIRYLDFPGFLSAAL
jgi:hypothetical protein